MKASETHPWINGAKSTLVMQVLGNTVAIWRKMQTRLQYQMHAFQQGFWRLWPKIVKSFPYHRPKLMSQLGRLF